MKPTIPFEKNKLKVNQYEYINQYNSYQKERKRFLRPDDFSREFYQTLKRINRESLLENKKKSTFNVAKQPDITVR